MPKHIQNFSELFSDKDILLEYDKTNKAEIKTILEKLDNTTLRNNISVEFIFDDSHYPFDDHLKGISVCINNTGETIHIDKTDIEKLYNIKKDLDKYYEKNSSTLSLSTKSVETHFNPNNNNILIGLKEQLIDFVILNKYINTDISLTKKQAMYHLSLLLYHEYYHYLFNELNIGDSKLIYRELLSKDEIYLKIINQYRNEKLAWKFAREWIDNNIEEQPLDLLINASMFSYSSYCKKALDMLNQPYSDFVILMDVPLIIKH